MFYSHESESDLPFHPDSHPLCLSITSWNGRRRSLSSSIRCESSSHDQ